ncbi:hypothetical protein JOC33_002863 [Thalassobacillus pellis]|nr:hypothetical protein [Thalassobacillus pellis]
MKRIFAKMLGQHQKEILLMRVDILKTYVKNNLY